MIFAVLLFAIFSLARDARAGSTLPQIPIFGDGVPQSFVDDKASRLRGLTGDFIALGRDEHFHPGNDEKRRAQSSRATNLVVNGGFETGSFSGWVQFGNTGFSSVQAGSLREGVFYGNFGPIGSTGGYQQTIATTAGTSYTLSYAVQFDGGATSVFSASFDGTTVESVTNPPSSAFVYRTFTVVASGASTVV
jgi:hypothetical protein